MIALTERTDKQVAKILEVLEDQYRPSHPKARIDAYRYNPASIRIRIIDPEFKGQLMTERGEHVWRVLRDKLTKQVFGHISLLLMLTPQETKRSMMNMEFEQPTYSNGLPP